MDKKLKILFLEDQLTDAELIWHDLEKNQLTFEKELVDNREDYITKIGTFQPDIIVSDYSLPQFDGMKALLVRNDLVPMTPFIIVTGTINEEVAVECMKAGADDYILKDNLSRLAPALKNARRKIKLIEEKKNAEEELKISEMRLQKAQSIAHVGNWELDFSNKLIWCSEEALRIYGFKEGYHEVPLSKVQKTVLPEYRLIIEEALDKLLKYNEACEVEFKIKRQTDGVIRAVLIKAELLVNKSDNQVKIIGVIQDITNRKLAEEELFQSYAFSDSLLKTIPFGMDIVDENGTVLFQSDNFKFLFGSEAIGKKCWDLYRDDKKQCSDCPLIKGIEVGETEAYESSGVLGNRVFEISHTGMVYKGKKAMLEIFQDITDRKQAEAELINARDRAEESDRLKTAFLHNISHEIRTPMNAIVGFSALLSEQGVDEVSQKSYIDIIMQSSNHLLAIITDIVDIANIEANLVRIDKKEVNLNSVLKTLYDQFLPRAKEKRLSLICEVDPDNSDLNVLTDNTKLFQILSNLVNNSLKFTQSGYIRFNYLVKDDFIEFCVEDTGIGIPVQYQSKVFNRFYQVQNNLERLFEGTGLGLSISQAYVELMGGKIRLESEPKNGTTFYFTIPYEKAVIQEVSIDHQSADRVKIFEFPVKKRILVAEDVESNFKLIEYFLMNSNIEVIRAVNGKDAVEKFISEKNIDLIFMDIKMPVMDGYTATKLIRESGSNVPIIAQTAYADDRHKAVESGCTAFISKPFNKKRLLNILAEYI